MTFAMKLSLAAYFNTVKKLPVEIILRNNTNSKFNPTYYVCKENNNLWIVTRGSFSAGDWLSDFDFEQKDVDFGKYSISFHGGFYQSARNLYNNVKPYLEAHNGPIYFTGHSYGGSVTTALLAIAMSEMPGKDFNGLAYAAAPTMNEDIPASIYNKLVTVVNKNDLVPTLSIGNAYRTFKNIIDQGIAVEEKITKKIQTLIDFIKNIPLEFAKSLAANLEINTKKIVNAIINFDKNNKDVGAVQYVSGNVYHVYKSRPKKLSEDIEDPSVTLNKLALQLDALPHHEGNMYLWAIAPQIDA
jgi:hypothetical protein